MMGGISSERTDDTTMPSPLPFDDFFRLEYPRLVPMLWAVLGDRSLAEDVAQETLAAAHQAWPRIQRYDKPGAWVRRVALNRAANARRRRGRETVVLRRVGVGEPTGPTGELAPPPDETLWSLIRALPDQQRSAVALHYVEDRSIADIATVLECSEGTVKTHLSRARATVARQLPDRPAEASS